MTLDHHLGLLESSGLIRLATLEPEVEYLFRHALIQDAAYSSLVKADRKDLHRAVGEALEHLYADQQETLAPLLGRHFAEARDDARALHYFILAGDNAAHHYANVEAAAHYGRAIGIAKTLTQPKEAVGDLTSLYLKRGRMLQLNYWHDEARANYVEMESTARTRGDRALELAALTARATLHSVLSPVFDPAQAQTLSNQALALAHELGDRAAEAKILWNLMLLYYYTGRDSSQAVAYGEQSLALAREFQLSEQLTYTLNDLALAYLSTGQWARALSAVDEAREMWHGQGNLPMLADNLTKTAQIHYHAGQFGPALAAAQEMLHVCQASQNWAQAMISGLFMGPINLAWGQPRQAIESLEEALRLGERVEHPAPEMLLRALLGWTYGSLGALDHALALARPAHEEVQRSPMGAVLRPGVAGMYARLLLLKGEVAEADAALRDTLRDFDLQQAAISRLLSWEQTVFARVELALAQGKAAHAVSLASEFLNALRQSDTRAFLTEALYLRGKALLALGQFDQARKALAEARALAESMNVRLILWPTLIALSQIEGQRGTLRDAEAQTLRTQARAVVEYIADHSPPDFRPTFRNLPGVRTMWNPNDPGKPPQHT